MSTDKVTARAAEDTETIDPALIEAYLRDHPGFFRHRPDVLAALQLPHGGEGAVSLVERQVSLLRERNIDMRKRLATVSENAEHNEQLFNGTRTLVLRLLDATDSEQIMNLFNTVMKDAFKVQLSSLLWLPTAGDVIPGARTVNAETADIVSNLVRHGKTLCGVLRAEEMRALFGDRTGEGSAAIAPLMLEGQLVGVLAVGNTDVEHYQAADGTLFLDYLAEVIVRLSPLRQPDTQ